MDNQTDSARDDNICGEHISSTSLPPDWRSQISTTLGKACWAGDLKVVQYIFSEITEGPDLDDIKAHFFAPLLWACSRGYPDILMCLLEHGAPIKDCASYVRGLEDTDTAICIFEILFQYGLDLRDYPDIVHIEYLLCNGADPNGLDCYDSVVLDLCSTESTIKLLIDYDADLSLSHLLQHFVTFPTQSYSEADCEFLLSLGVDVNAPAICSGHSPPGSKRYCDAVRQLLDGGTALHFLVRGANRRAWLDGDPIPRMKWLLEHGADVNIKDDRGLTPLDYATEPAVIELLKSYKS